MRWDKTLLENSKLNALIRSEDLLGLVFLSLTSEYTEIHADIQVELELAVDK